MKTNELYELLPKTELGRLLKLQNESRVSVIISETAKGKYNLTKKIVNSLELSLISSSSSSQSIIIHSLL